MSAEQTPDIAELVAVLAEHEDITFDLGTPRQYTEHGGWNQHCGCGYPLGDAGDGGDEGEARVAARHRAHVAAALAPVLAAAVREAEQRALQDAAGWRTTAKEYEGQVEDLAAILAANAMREAADDFRAEVAGSLRPSYVTTDVFKVWMWFRTRADRITEPVSHEAATEVEP